MLPTVGMNAAGRCARVFVRVGDKIRRVRAAA